MKVTVDMSKCQGFGNCAEQAPERFELDEWGYVLLRDGGDVPEGQQEPVRQGVAACPVEALALHD